MQAVQLRLYKKHDALCSDAVYEISFSILFFYSYNIDV